MQLHVYPEYLLTRALIHPPPFPITSSLIPVPQLAIYGQGQQAWCCDYCQKCVGCGKGNEGALTEEGTPLICTERGKVHHAHIDAPEGSEPGPRANEKVIYGGVFRGMEILGTMNKLVKGSLMKTGIPIPLSCIRPS